MANSNITQKVLIKEREKSSYEYKDFSIPQPKEGEVLVKVLKVSICGSDIALYHWNEGNRERLQNHLMFTFALANIKT